MAKRPQCPEQRRPRVYISGPMSVGDREENIRRAEEAALALIQMGFAVFCPQLTGQMTGHEAITHDDWIENDLSWVEVADAVLRIEGESEGADVECGHAECHGIPIYHHKPLWDGDDWKRLLGDRELLVSWSAKRLGDPVRVPPDATADRPEHVIWAAPAEIFDPAFDAILDEVRELHERKAEDYVRDGDPLANVRAAEDYGIEPWVGVEIRLNDKQRRIQRFVQRGELRNESVEGPLIDRCVYSIISLQLYREGK